MDANLQPVRGQNRASSALLLKAQLKKQGIIVKKTALYQNLLFFDKKISRALIINFYQQLAALLHTGIPLTMALTLSASACKHFKIRLLILEIKNHIENGKTLSETLAEYPEYFDLLACNLLYAGEQTGNLPMMLAKIVEYKKTLGLIKNKIQKALYYPLIVLGMACIIITVLLVYVIPQLQVLFADFGKQLPVYTRVIMNISTHLRHLGCLLPIFLLVFYGARAFLKKRGYIRGTIPILTPVIEKYLTARWTYTLSIALGAGIPLTHSVQIIIKTMQKSRYQEAFMQIKSQILQGHSLHTAMQNTGVFQAQVNQMIYIGEQSGSLPVVLTELASLYQTEANDHIDTLLGLLEPLLIIFLGVIIGNIVVAMYLPIFKLGSVM